MAEAAKSSSGHGGARIGSGGARPGAGRKKNVELGDAYTAYNKARAKKAIHDARMAEMEEKKMAGQLVPADEVEKRFVDAAARVKSKLLAIPGKVSPFVIAISDLGEADALIKKAIHEALEELRP